MGCALKFLPPVTKSGFLVWALIVGGGGIVVFLDHVFWDEMNPFLVPKQHSSTFTCQSGSLARLSLT